MVDNGVKWGNRLASDLTTNNIVYFFFFRVDFSLEEIDTLSPGELKDSSSVEETLLGNQPFFLLIVY